MSEAEDAPLYRQPGQSDLEWMRELESWAHEYGGEVGLVPGEDDRYAVVLVEVRRHRTESFKDMVELEVIDRRPTGELDYTLVMKNDALQRLARQVRRARWRQRLGR